MANTYTQYYFQFVFAVQNRQSLIKPEWEQQLYKYITGIVQKNGHKLIAINGMEDHIHLFIGLHTTQSTSELMRLVKGESSEWINKQGFVKGIFRWQEGYGGFTYGRSQIDRVYKYVMNQKQHHKRMSFLEEYVLLLDKFEIADDKKYIFKYIE